MHEVHNTLTFIREHIEGDDMTRHGLMMVTFSGLAGFLMYLYQLSMGILLEPEQYSILFSLTSLLIISMVFPQTINTTMLPFHLGRTKTLVSG